MPWFCFGMTTWMLPMESPKVSIIQTVLSCMPSCIAANRILETPPTGSEEWEGTGHFRKLQIVCRTFCGPGAKSNGNVHWRRMVNGRRLSSLMHASERRAVKFGFYAKSSEWSLRFYWSGFVGS